MNAEWDFSTPTPEPKRSMTAAELLDVTEVERLALGPGDTVVIKVPVDRRLSDAERQYLHDQVRAVIPEPTKILILGSGCDISVIRATP